MASGLVGKVFIVTGGANGFGLAIVQRVVAEGAKVVVFDLAKPVDGAFGAAAGSVVAFQGSVTNAADWKTVVDLTLSSFGKLDVVVNNAGINMTAVPTHQVTEEFFDRIMAINLKSIFHSISTAAPIMYAQKSGCFVHISSVGALRPKPQIAYYCATKAAINAISKSIAIEYAPYVRSVAIAPSMGNTAMMTHNLGPGVANTAANVAPLIANIPMGRMCEPSDVANAVAFLASDQANYLTGNVLEVDGGRTI